MDFNNLNRSEVIELVGEQVLAQLENIACFPTCRLQDDCDNTVEYRADMLLPKEQQVLSALYYPLKSQFFRPNGESIDNEDEVDWVIDHYRLI